MKPSTSKMEAFQNCRNLSKKDKKFATAYIKSNFDTNPEVLYDFLNFLLPTSKSISDPEAIEWCKWLMAGGLTPEAFAREVKKYDNATTCGLVWTANFVAYRCRTCGISPCMSLCAECFQRGNHEGHDFNMFRSQAGGACDCGDIFVMKESGFCGRHGPQAHELKPSAPVDLLLLPHAMMPRLIFRLMQHFRSYKEAASKVIDEADNFLTMLQDFSSLGAAVRGVMTHAITDPEVYKDLKFDVGQGTHLNALEALGLVPSLSEEYKDCLSLQPTQMRKSFLEELMFWTVQLEFPQKIVCLMLNMLPDPDYKEALTRSFVLNYSRIPMMLEQSTSPDTLSNRVVHVSVQLFSNEGLAFRMTEQLQLLHVMVLSLRCMMSKILIPNTLNEPKKNFHFVVDCARQVMKEHCYWPLVSDLNNVLSHRPVALKFMSEQSLLEMWFIFLSMFQGMNVNQREMSQHVEFEPSTYYAAFSAELEASAYPMWALVGHLRDSSTIHLTRGVLQACTAALQEWFDAIDFREPTTKDFRQVSFHLPLHRYLAILMSQAVKCQGVSLSEVLPPRDMLKLIYQHPLRLQVAFYEILNGMWVRNGLQIKGQMMTYIQCNFCNSMVDADLYLLQVCATQIDSEEFLLNVLKMFRVIQPLSIAVIRTTPPFCLYDNEFEPSMLESCLTFLATLINIRSNLGANEAWLSKLEMVTLLCMGDKTHSQLMELMPERCGTGPSRDLDTMLIEVADYRAPNNMQQGMYAPKPHVWEDLYDPIHVLLRAVHRRDFQTSMDRFTEYVQQTRKLKPGSENIWPPLRPPSPCGSAYEDPCKILQSRVLHAVVFCVLYQAIERRNMSEHMLALTIYLLEMAVITCPPPESQMLFQEDTPKRYGVRDRDVSSFYESDWLPLNLRTVIGSQVNCVLRNVTTEPDAEGTDDTSNMDVASEDNFIVVTEDDMVPYYPPITFTANPFFPSAIPSSSGSAGGSNEVAVIASGSTSSGTVAPVAGSSSSSSSTGSAGANSASNNNSALFRRRRMMKSSSKLRSVTPAIMESIWNGVYFDCSLPGVETGEDMTEMTFSLDESIISLLLKLHSALSGSPDSYVMGQQQAQGLLDSRIGDGPFFVAKVLDRIAELDDACRQFIIETRARLWPLHAEELGNEAKAREAEEREERRRKAKERQDKLMQEFANKQKQFMEKTMQTEEAESMDWNDEGEKKKCEYDCVICNQSSPSTEDKPMGLVVLLQSTSVLAHMKPDIVDVQLPTSEPTCPPAYPHRARAAAFNKRMAIVENTFDPASWQLAVSIGWEGGVHVQTCGHHLHLDCLTSYLLSLKGQTRPHSPAVEKGEYLCPLCRQLANSVLPLAADLGDLTAVVRARPLGFSAQISGIGALLEGTADTLQQLRKPLADAMHKSMQDMTTASPAATRFRPAEDGPPQSRFLFVSSLARTNLEIEMVQRGGTFVTRPGPEPSLIPKRSCIVPLLHVLAVHGRSLNPCPPELLWRELTDANADRDAATQGLVAQTRQVPLMLTDPTALLIRLLLLLPIKIDQSYFSCVVKCVFNLLYFQVLTQLSIKMTEQERNSWRDPKAQPMAPAQPANLDAAMAFVLSQLGGCSTLLLEGVASTADDSSDSHKEDDARDLTLRSAVERTVQNLCLPFLRIAALLRHHLFAEEIPNIRTDQTEFVRLVYYLELVTDGMDWGRFNAAVAVNMPEESPNLVVSWLRQLIASSTWCAAASLMSTMHDVWYPPRLLSLPQLYDKMFQFYHARPCVHCGNVPREASLCLICGTLVCLKEICCKENMVCEGVEHGLSCGAGTAIFLVVTSSYVIVIRGKRACLWGSVYLDSFGEEDRELKRGKPLYLCPERYRLLQEQWLAHRFEHTNKKWVWHRDAL